MDSLSLAIIGLGNMGQLHARALLAGKISRGRLGAVVDADPARTAAFPGVPAFASIDALIAAQVCDAVLIATPHFSHTDLGIATLRAGLHVLVEKPISVHKADAERLIAAHQNPRQVFAAMFNQRTDPYYQTIRRMIQSGELGKVRRVQWTVTDWFRTHAYYRSGGWRATWAGEGGGVLLNQCPHNLDLYQWLFGLPEKITAFCAFGRYHDIEVEDDVTAYLEHPGGLHGTFITSTGEAPGTNRLEIVAENGRLVYEHDVLTYTRNKIAMSEYSRTTHEAFGRPESEKIQLPASGHGGQHVEIIQNFVDAVLDGTPLIAPAAEGLHSVELANAMLASAWQKQTVTLPLSGDVYARLLDARIQASPRKPADPAVATRAPVSPL